MTRSRAKFGGTPGEDAALYHGQGFMNTPGIDTDAHVAGWRALADAVHARERASSSS